MVVINTRGGRDHKYNKKNIYIADKNINDNIINNHAIIFVHGYNSKTKTVIEAYTTMYEHIKHKPIDVYGFVWANRGKWWAYFGDLKRTREGGRRLNCLIKALLSVYNYEKASIICHSMGSYLVMNMLSRFGRDITVHRVAIMGGDAKVRKFVKWRKFGLVCDTIQGLDSYYSKRDRVLRIIAPKIRFGERVGSTMFLEDTPKNYSSVNAQVFSDHPVRHRSYKNLGRLLTFATKRLLK